MPDAAVASGPRVPSHATDQLRDIAADVFSSMVGLELTHVAETCGFVANPAQVVGTVAFAGSWTGYVAIVTSQAAARELTAALLGPDPGDVDAQVRDALGEVVNVVAGGFRARMLKPGEPWAITVPLVATGEAISLSHPREAFHAVHWFRFGDQMIEVHLIVTSLSDPTLQP